jgi:hypothetical protein
VRLLHQRFGAGGHHSTRMPVEAAPTDLTTRTARQAVNMAQASPHSQSRSQE